MVKKESLTKLQMSERRQLVFMRFKKEVDKLSPIKKGNIKNIAEKIATEFGYSTKATISIYYDGINGKLDKYKTTYKTNKITLFDFGDTLIKFCILMLKEECEWIDHIQLKYTITKLNDTNGMIFRGRFTSKHNKIPVYVDESKIQESIELVPEWEKFTIVINDIKDVTSMYKRLKEELHDIVECYNNNG